MLCLSCLYTSSSSLMLICLADISKYIGTTFVVPIYLLICLADMSCSFVVLICRPHLSCRARRTPSCGLSTSSPPHGSLSCSPTVARAPTRPSSRTPRPSTPLPTSKSGRSRALYVCARMSFLYVSCFICLCFICRAFYVLLVCLACLHVLPVCLAYMSDTPLPTCILVHRTGPDARFRHGPPEVP